MFELFTADCQTVRDMNPAVVSTTV